jgi:radical SAM protein with 4Fe4S-binding SPASM domain
MGDMNFIKEELKKKMIDTELKWKVGWGITAKCNMTCKFCYSSNARKSCKDLHLHTCIDFINRNSDWIESINYGTGENTLSNSWYDLVKYVHNNHPEVKQALTTNGYLSTALSIRSDSDEILLSLDEVDVSIDLGDPTKHGVFRGNEKAFDWAIQTIEMCRAKGIPTTIVVMGIDKTLTKDNLDGIFEIAMKFGCFVRINIFRPNEHQKIDPLSYRRLKESILYLAQKWKIVSLSDPLISGLLLHKLCQDPSGKSSLRILPDGSISPSTYLVTNNWRRASIIDAKIGCEEFQNCISEGLMAVSPPTECLKCPILVYCNGGAIDRRIIWYGGLDQRDPYCPTRHMETTDEWFIPSELTIVDGPNVHDGYLPTLIFSSQQKDPNW